MDDRRHCAHELHDGSDLPADLRRSRPGVPAPYRSFLPLDPWLSREGAGLGPRTETLANFYFGGFGNNWVDHSDVAQYRDQSSFPGIDVNLQASVAGTDYGKLTLEWDLPPLRFRRMGLQDFYVTWARCALFSSGIVTNVGDPVFRTEFYNVGAQLDFRLVLFSSLPSTFSMGYASASRDWRTWSHEYMISLKIL